MKKVMLFLLCTIFVHHMVLSQTSSTIMDINGNVYKTVIIGNQVWMLENLRVTKYQNGDSLINLYKVEDWTNSKKIGYSYFNNDTSNKYGLLYKNNVIYDKRNICPVGWKIPTSVDFKELSDYFGGRDTENNIVSVAYLKISPKWNSVFNTSLYGFKSSNGQFHGLNVSTGYWVKDEGKLPRNFLINPSLDYYIIVGESGWSGHYIRCIKNN